MSQLHRLEIEDRITLEVIAAVRAVFRAKTLTEKYADRLDGSHILEALGELREVEAVVTEFAEKLHDAQWSSDEVAELERQFAQ